MTNESQGQGGPKAVGKPKVQSGPKAVGKPKVRGGPKTVGQPKVRDGPKAARKPSKTEGLEDVWLEEFEDDEEEEFDEDGLVDDDDANNELVDNKKNPAPAPLSEYEQLREARIQRSNAKLASLGLSYNGGNITRQTSNKKKKTKHTTVVNPRQLPTRAARAKTTSYTEYSDEEDK
jgi:hypothetical protein